MLSPSHVFKNANKSKGTNQSMMTKHVKDSSIDSKSSRTTQLIQQMKQDQLKENKSLAIINLQSENSSFNKNKFKAEQVLEYV